MNIINRLATVIISNSVVGLSFLFASPVYAQEQTNVSILEEIIVTARRRDERITDVPDAITVITDKDRDLLVLEDMGDYLRQVPGTVLVNGGPNYLNDISMRGQGGGRIGFSESATGIFRNGSYIAGGGFGGRSLNRMDFFDMESLQVYRGPQGALYGRNAVGGAVNVISKQPTNEFEGWAELAYDNIEETSLQAVLNLPVLEDVFNLRLGGYYIDQNDGFITDVNTGNSLDRSSNKGFRVAAEAITSDTFSMNLIVEYREDEAAGFSSLGYRQFRTDGVLLDPSEFERDVSSDGRVEIDEFATFLNLLWQTSIGEVHADFSFKDRDGGRFDEDYDHFIGFQNRVIAGVPVELFSTQTEEFSRFGGVVYLSSAKDVSSWNWLVGAEYQTYDDDVDTNINGYGGTPALNALRQTEEFVENLSSVALFGSVQISLAEQWRLDLEGRLQQDSKDYVFARTPQSSQTPTLTSDEDETWTEFTPAVTVSFNPSEDHLVYGRMSTGYRPGGFNSGIPSDLPNAANLIAFDPEFTTSAELGWKGPLFSPMLRADLAIFYAQTDDVQAVTAASATSSGFILQNAGDNATWGYEFQMIGVFEAGPGNLRLTLGLSGNDGDWDDGSAVILAGATVDIAGNRVNRTRDLITTLNAAYILPVGGDRHLTFSGSYQAAQGGFENVISTRLLEDYNLLDARIILSSTHWQFSLFGKNLTDEIYVLQEVSMNQYFNEGRTYGISAKYSF